MNFSLRGSVMFLIFVLLASLGSAARAATSAEYKIADTPKWVTPLVPVMTATTTLDQQSGGVSYLLVDRQVWVMGNDKQVYSHQALRIENESGLETAANVEIRFDPSYQTLILHSVVIRRGTQIFSKLNANTVRVLQREKSLEYLVFDGTKTANLFLDGVQVGDVIEYAYTLRGSNPVFDGQHYGRFDLQWGVPVQRVYARLLTKPQRSPYIKLHNTTQMPVRRMMDGMQEHVWDLTGVVPLRSRDDTPYGFNPYPYVQWSDFKDWAAVVQWALPLYAVPAQLGSELTVEVERIRQAFPHPADRVMEVLRLVQKNVRYLGVEVGAGSHAPSPPHVVWARRFGDCKDKTLLTLTLLKALQIDAHAALVNTKLRRGVLDWQAGPGAFDHVIAQIAIEGENYWLDSTLQPQMGGLADISQPNYGYALVLGAGQNALTEIKVGDATSYKRRVLAVYDIRGSWSTPVPLTVTTVLEGLGAENLRSVLAKESADAFQKQLTNYYARHYLGITAVRPFEVVDNKKTNQITTTEYYAIADFWRKVKDDKVEAYVAAPDVQDYLRTPQNTVRDEPMGLVHPSDVRQTTYVLLPPDITAKNGLSRIKNSAFETESSSLYSPGRLMLVDAYRSLSDSIAVDQLPAYLSNLRQARELLGASFTRSMKDAQ